MLNQGTVFYIENSLLKLGEQEKLMIFAMFLDTEENVKFHLTSNICIISFNLLISYLKNCRNQIQDHTLASGIWFADSITKSSPQPST